MHQLMCFVFYMLPKKHKKKQLTFKLFFKDHNFLKDPFSNYYLNARTNVTFDKNRIKKTF